MIHKVGLYIIAAFLSFALSSVETATEEEILCTVSNLAGEDLSLRNSETFFIVNKEERGEYAISGDTKYRVDTPLRRFSSSDSFRRLVRRTANVCHLVIDNGDNAIRNTLHSFACFTHGRHSSGLDEPARYLIRLRKFII